MPFEIVRADITTLEVDAIVNAANTGLAPGGGVCGAIFAAAGYADMERACRAIGHCSVGQAVITEGFALPARRVIHTVGPIWRGGRQGEAALLKSCYQSSLLLAEENRCQSVAFPLISSGIYGYPKREALQIAVETISAFLHDHEMQVYLAVFDRSAVVLSEHLQGRIQAYIDDHYVDSRSVRRKAQERGWQLRQLEEQAQAQPSPPPVCGASFAAPAPAPSPPEIPCIFAPPPLGSSAPQIHSPLSAVCTAPGRFHSR